ncbi:DUF2848 domain-containing protein [Musicola paradisiaca]|uniref:DUF2848 domain-containing protein n=1 Tax=Musicola paradisiaca (strain Ech703) TaxID=579405 RepID=C6C3B1_MUSP7|nr:DUF2848 domain-containing protein [Musicola paradisiaca]ACS87209.1 conserved hypothetical protein [Musicola paradisiaca Ech703]
MTLLFDLPDDFETDLMDLEVKELVIAGWTGRDREAVMHHIRELELLGVPQPSAIPLFYRVAANQLSQSAQIDVVGETTSGEAEPLLFCRQGEWFVSLASDHTDRELEASSVALSKQVCVKPVAHQAWRFADVEAYWDQLVLRSWILEDGDYRLYQQGTLAGLRRPEELLSLYRERSGEALPADGLAMSCGTVPAIGGIRPAQAFRMELIDERRGRVISHQYAITALPVVA